MSSSSNLKERILELRRKQKSYNEISEILGIRKGRISYWIAKDPESRKVKEILTERNNRRSKRRIKRVIKAQKARWEQWGLVAHEEAIREFRKLKNNSLFTAGIMLYWGEGDSNPKNPLRLSNTTPALIALYVSFLKEILKVPDNKIRLGLVLYPDLSDTHCKNFWAKTTFLPQNAFVKTQYIKGFHPTKRLSYGVCMVTVNSRRYKIKVQTWIDLFSKHFTMD